MAYVAQLDKDFGRFRDDFELVGKHLGHAQSKFAEADRRLDRFETKLERAADSEQSVPAAQELSELPRAADAA
jgi:DNA recombination protein RmuC